MRALLGWFLVMGLAVSPAMAGTSSTEESSTAASKASSDSSTAAKPKAAAVVAAKTDAKPEASSTESELEEVRDLLESQSRQIQEQSEQLKIQQQKMQALEEQLKASTAKPATITALPAASTAAGAATITATVPAASAVAPSPAPLPQGIPDSPVQFHIGSAYITPVGFMDFTGVGRDKNAGGGIGSNFGSIPYEFPTSAAGINLLDHTTEARFSMQNSRVGLRVDALVKGAHVIGYTEWDFLGNNPSNVAVTSNSNTFRSRLYWVDVAKDKWEFLAGQTWSLITPGRTGISPLPGNIFYSQDIDVNYQAGLAWGRIPEFRFVYHPTSKAAIAFALDNQEMYIGGSAGGPKLTFPTGPTVVNGVSTLAGTQLNDGSTSTNAPQVFPDVIVKVAIDPSPKLHFELGGVERQFRVAVNSTTSSSSPIVHQGLTGGGGFANLNVQLFSGFRLLTNNFWSVAAGRYIFGQVPDVIVRPDGSLSAITAFSTVDGFEYTHKNMLLYAYYGGIHIDKNIAVVNGLDYGYGVDATGATAVYKDAISQNRAIQEATVGFNQTMWRDAKYGALNLMGQYSYIFRNPWSVAPDNPTHASLNLAFVNLRYTLPGGAPAASALK